MDDAIETGSTERFGYEWHHYANVLPEYEGQFRRWLPFYAPEDWRGKRFLDVGCGMGRNSYWPMSYGAAGGVAADLDERSLTAARATLAQFSDRFQVARASAYALPWKDEFDVAFSIGVVHHLENPELALKNMVRSIKPGGQVAIWVYGNQNVHFFLWALQPMRKYIFSRMPIGWVHSLSILPTALLWVLLQIGFGRIQYFQLLRQFSFSHLRSIVFDQMLPKIAHYWTRSQVEGLMKGCGLMEIEVMEVNEVSWAARGKKAAA